jgi:hypothetical protein
MNRVTRNNLILAATALLAAGLLTGCGDVSFEPPSFPNAIPQSPQATSPRTLEIVGSLTTEQGACVEATILFDGEELPGARAVCVQGRGCTELELTGLAHSANGRHTISFQVLRQSQEAIDYLAHGTVRVTRENLVLWDGVRLSLRPTRATLRSGESVTFDLELWD